MVGLLFIQQNNTILPERSEAPNANEHEYVHLNKLADSLLWDPDLIPYENKRSIAIQASYISLACDLNIFVYFVVLRQPHRGRLIFKGLPLLRLRLTKSPIFSKVPYLPTIHKIIMQTSAFAHYIKYCSSFRNSPVDQFAELFGQGSAKVPSLPSAIQRAPWLRTTSQEHSVPENTSLQFHWLISLWLQTLSSQAVAKSPQVPGINSHRWQVDNSGKVAVVGDNVGSIQEVQKLVYCRAGCFVHCCKYFHEEERWTHSCRCKDSSNSEAKGEPSYKWPVTVVIVNEQDKDKHEGLQQWLLTSATAKLTAEM